MRVSKVSYAVVSESMVIGTRRYERFEVERRTIHAGVGPAVWRTGTRLGDLL